MTINTTDIKLLESERMTDTANGGGRRTSRVIVDGEPGNIFPKVSRLDSVYGRVNLRKIYGAVVTENLDTYAGAHAIILDPPNNAQIHTNLFSTGSDYDTRTAARDRIESYVVAGPESRAILYGRQLVGQQAVLVYQRIEEPLPEVGEVYCLSKEAGGTIVYQQFVRVTDISSEVRTFTDSDGDFQRRIVTMEIGAPLRNEFRGPDTPSRLSNVARESLVRGTTVADAARYYGIQPLAEAADEDSLTVRVDSVYSPIVPTTQRESPINLASISGAAVSVDISSATVSQSLNTLTGTAARTFYLPKSIKRGSLLISGTASAEDDGAGNIVSTSSGGNQITGGTVNYESGVITLVANFVGGIAAAEYVPVAEVSQPARTEEIEITLGNRGTVYSVPLLPTPAPGSLILDYRSLGRWYRLRDNGAGALIGDDPDFGTGTIDYVTGGLVVTLGALPDVDSSVLISWGSPVDYTVRAGATSNAAAGLQQSFTLSQLPVQPGTLVLTFTSGTTAYTATASGSGVISGNGVTGVVNHATGVVEITYTTRLPNGGSNVVAAYNQLVESDPENPINVSGSISWLSPATLSPVPLIAGTFSATMEIDYQSGGLRGGKGTVAVSDNGAGLLVVKANQPVASNTYGAGMTTSADVTVGAINYSTGAITIPDTSNIVPVTVRYWAGLFWIDLPAFADITATAGAYIYTQAGGDPVQTARSDSFSTTESPLIVNLTTTTADAVVPGSVLFRINGTAAIFFDRNGTIFTDLNNLTGEALACGSIDYETGRASLTGQWPENGTAINLEVQACLTVFGNFSSSEAFFRTAGSPLRPGSVFIQATALDGSVISGTSDENGVITGAKLRGEVVQDMGVVRVEFGEEIESVWTPIEIAPSTLRYSAVVLSNLPLNADILGLDPVRLPSDGRVPIYRPADVVVIHHTDSYALPNPAVAGSTYSVGRTNLAELWLVDADGDRVPTTKFTVNLAAGSVTMAADLDLTGYTQPLVARHRIEEMQLLSDVQINGQLGLTATLSRDFPLGSYVSSALLFGDMQASVPALFDQATWTSVWSDSLIGSAATAQYNDVDYPIEVLNDGAQTDRWRINFTTGNPTSGTASFQVISENLGVIATGNTGSDCAPVNVLTGKPYFVIRAAGWGLGWSVGNQLRFNTQAAAEPIWIARTVLPGATLDGDSFDLALRGDVDA